jgi:glycosyltransferase involved in cell wall biosynthesis
MQNPLVSVLCITYNHKKYIRQALDSFLMQERISLSRLLSMTTLQRTAPRKSSANTFACIRIGSELSCRRRIRCRSGFPLGILISGAKGKYIAFCEGDDFWADSRKLQKQAEYMESNPRCTLCVHAADYVNPDEAL